ncbi:MAG: VanW family protein, partial [Candidatus Levybacteria bacterium]|nr:VanW family protein [Candidatus Levybacteria bacterium]
MKYHHLIKKPNYIIGLKSVFWFFVGVLLGLFLLVSFLFLLFQRIYSTVIYPGIAISNYHVGGKTQEEVRAFFATKNAAIPDTKFVLVTNTEMATISAKQLQIGYDEKLLANQAYSIGRSNDPIINISLIFQAYISGLDLQPSYRYSEETLEHLLYPLAKKIHKDPVNALFTFENGRVSAFQLSSEGQEVDLPSLKETIHEKAIMAITQTKPQTLVIQVPIKVLKPEVATDEANDKGIRELLASGTSLFQGSIESRIFNVTLASSRLNGVLIAPNEVFSFNKTIGDVSAFTGYKQAYVIQNGRTVLGDGGGVCQVSTTLFRAVLNAGLPIVERHAHAYRVHYYEEDSPPGIDATVYIPTVDFKFKNDTGHYILIQNVVDPISLRLTFFLYGTKDNRQVTLSEPVITSQTPAPEPLYQDDPTLPKGTVKQVDFAASGASVFF